MAQHAPTVLAVAAALGAIAGGAYIMSNEQAKKCAQDLWARVVETASQSTASAQAACSSGAGRLREGASAAFARGSAACSSGAAALLEKAQAAQAACSTGAERLLGAIEARVPSLALSRAGSSRSLAASEPDAGAVTPQSSASAPRPKIERLASFPLNRVEDEEEEEEDVRQEDVRQARAARPPKAPSSKGRKGAAVEVAAAAGTVMAA